MTAAKYKSERLKRGTQKKVAAQLGINYRTIMRRERGDTPIIREAELALLALPEK